MGLGRKLGWWLLAALVAAVPAAAHIEPAARTASARAAVSPPGVLHVGGGERAVLRFDLRRTRGKVAGARLHLHVRRARRGGPLLVRTTGGRTVARLGRLPRSGEIVLDVSRAVRAPRRVTLVLSRAGGRASFYARGMRAPRLDVTTRPEALEVPPVRDSPQPEPEPTPQATPAPTVAPTVGPTPEPAVVAVAADIACDPVHPSFNGGLGTPTECRHRAISDLVLAEPQLDAVLIPGDLQYETGTLEQFLGSYDPTWGRLKAITHPVPGNHEYQTPQAAGYYDYFGAIAGDRTKGYYSFDVGAWHVVALNSVCWEVGGCHPGSPQEQWLRADLAAHPADCTLAYWHHPRFASGSHGDEDMTDGLWRALYEAGAELVLSGHDHNYERLAPVDPAGARDPERGMRSFVVGTGGKSLRPAGAVVNPAQEAFDSTTYGFLRLTLRAGGYDWTFVGEPGATFTDSGSGSCH